MTKPFLFASLSAALLFAPGSLALADTEITYQFWGSPAEAEVWKNVAAAFEQKHPGIHVVVEASDWDSYWEKLKVKVAGGTPPDVFAMDAPLYPDWQSRDVLLNLQPYIDAQPGYLEKIFPITLEAYKTKDGYFGLPRDFQTIMLFYNKDMFDAAGIKYPDESWTYDTFREVAKKLTIDKDGDGKTDQWGAWADIVDPEPFWGAVIWSFGGDIVDVENRKTLIGSNEARAGFDFIASMLLEDKSMPTTEQLDQFGHEGFTAGVAAMGYSGHWSVPDYSGASFKWDVAPLPKGPAGRITGVNSAGFVIAKATPHPKEAWEFVKYATGPEGQAELAKIGLAVPINKDVAASNAYLDQAVKINHQMFVDALAYARTKPVFRGYEEWSSAVGDALIMAWSGQLPVSDAISEAVTAGDAALEKNK